ncbi:unnamed protein product, partial [Lepidochelys olivacea]
MSYTSETAQRNHSTVTQLIYLGFSQDPVTRALLCVGFSIIYTISLMGNSIINFITMLDLALHTPMYFFLWNLSFLESCYISVTIPKMLVNFVSEERTISFTGCAIQNHPDAFRPFSWDSRVLPAGRHGIQGHLLPSALPHHYESQSPCQDGCCLLALWNPDAHGQSDLHLLLALLWAQQDQPLLLRHPPCAEAGLWGHLQERGLHCTDQPNDHCHPLPNGAGVLCLHPLHHPEDNFIRGKAQSFLHLLLPPHCSHLVLWLNLCYVPAAQVQPCSGHGQSGGPILYSRHPHVKPYDLQPKEPGGEGCSEETEGEEKIFM